MANYRNLQNALDELAQSHNLKAMVVSDDDGLLIDSNSTCENAEPLAAYAPHVEAGNLWNEEAPTRAVRYTMGDFDIVVAAVGEPSDCEAALSDALPHLSVLVA